MLHYLVSYINSRSTFLSWKPTKNTTNSLEKEVERVTGIILDLTKIIGEYSKLEHSKRYDHIFYKNDKEIHETKLYGVLEGLSVSYIIMKNPDRVCLYTQENFHNGERHGSYKDYYVDIKRLCVQCNYRNGIVEGLYKSYYDNGKLRTECNYRNGELEGLYKSYDKNGIIYQEMYYRNGKLEGPCKSYF